MKPCRCLLLALALAAGAPVFAQTPSSAQVQSTPAPRALTKFNLDFPGGTPGELVAAIEKAMGRPLNAVIPSDETGRRLPALKMSGVDVAQLFAALLEAMNRPTIENGMPTQQQFGFRTQGVPTDDSIWFFWTSRPPQPMKYSQFFLLTPYLDRGLTVDDITTAIQTAWKMRGDRTSASMSFHKETKLLIAVGDGESLGAIAQALQALEPPKPARGAPATPPPPADSKP